MGERLDHLSANALRTIEQMHTAWIDLELAGQPQRLLDFCAADIEFRPPDAAAIVGHDAVAAFLHAGTARLHAIEIADRRIQASGGSASLTALYTTTFSLPDDPFPRQATGTHAWQLRREAERWLIVVVSWS